MPLDPKLAAKLHLVSDLRSWDEAFADPEKQARLFQFMEEDDDYTPPAVATTEEQVQSSAGAFRVRIYRPEGDVRGVFVWVHGGGFTGGAIDMPEGDFVSRELTERASVVVVSVDYAVATGDNGYPNLHHQVRDAYDWARGRAPEWGVDPADVVLGGGSAGANLVLAATAEALDAGAPLPPRLILAYPTAHQEQPEAEEVEELTKVFPPIFRFTPESVRDMYRAYANGAEHTPYLAMDGRSLRGFPPLIIIVDEYDDLRASGEELAEQARRDEVPVQLRLAPGMMHGHFNRNALVPQVDADLSFVAKALGEAPTSAATRAAEDA